MIYADTSVLMAQLTASDRQAEAMGLLETARKPLAIAALQELELVNAIELSVKFRTATPEVAAATHERLRRFLASDAIERVAIDHSRVFARARGLSVGHSRNLGTRSLDILHVASAMELGIRMFWSFDDRQRNLARAAGLEVNP